MEQKLTIYGIDGCAPCANAKRLCSVKGIPYTFIKVDTEAVKQTLLDRMNIKGNITVPQIFDATGVHIGGFRELKEWVKVNS